MSDPKRYQFGGTATVSVKCWVDAESEDEARATLATGWCEWECDQVDGDVSEIELLTEEED